MKPVQAAQEEDAYSCGFPEEEEGEECKLWMEIPKPLGLLEEGSKEKQEGSRYHSFQYWKTPSWTIPRITQVSSVMFTLFYYLSQFTDFREREEGREGGRFIGWFSYVPWLGIEPLTWAHWENILTNWATPPGPSFF